MPIRTIKAYSAIEDGDILRILTKSNRLYRVILAALVAATLAVLFQHQLEDLELILMMLIFVIIAYITGDSEIEREVPRADVVEIKRYDFPKRVTVVLDDERAKMARPGQPQKPAK